MGLNLIEENLEAKASPKSSSSVAANPVMHIFIVTQSKYNLFFKKYQNHFPGLDPTSLKTLKTIQVASWYSSITFGQVLQVIVTYFGRNMVCPLQRPS
jgi:hypothetical protein